MIVELIISNKPSEINKKVIKFLNANLYIMNKSQIQFNFQVATPETKDVFYNRNINNFPTLIYNNEQIVGIEKIMNYMKNKVVEYNKKILNKTDDDRVRDFWKETMGNCEKDENGIFKFNDDDDDNEDDAEKDMQRKIQKAFQERNNSEEEDKKESNKESHTMNISKKTKLSNKTEETPYDTIKNMGSGDIDDELMAKFFENQEESL